MKIFSFFAGRGNCCNLYRVMKRLLFCTVCGMQQKGQPETVGQIRAD